MEELANGRKLFLKAFVNSLIRSSYKISEKELAGENSVLYARQQIPFLQIPEEILKKNYNNLISNAMSSHKDDAIAAKIKSLINQRIQVPRKNLQTSQQAISQNSIKEEDEKRTIRQEGYELTQIKFPRPVNIQEIPSSGGENIMQIGALGMEKIAPSKDLPAPVKIRSMHLEPLEQMQAVAQHPLPNPRMQITRQTQPSVNMNAPQKIIPKPKQHTSILEELTIFGFAKLDELIQNPNIETIECPGPEKPILISQGGRVQPTNFTLKSDEIDRIMREISDKTRIPLTTGIFRASLRRYLITAVLSEFVGTRFIIQKKQGIESE
jgi:hypothetical protein